VQQIRKKRTEQEHRKKVKITNEEGQGKQEQKHQILTGNSSHSPIPFFIALYPREFRI